MLRLLTSTLFLIALAVSSSACCELSGTCGEPAADAGPPPPPAPPAEAFATAGCSVDDITDQNGEVCAACGDTAICGVPDVARCESRENAAGAECHFCATPAGEILYDSCNDATRADLKCEPAPADPGSGLVQGDVTCQKCTDANGNVVNTVCEPASDECHDVVDQGLTCRECTKDGAVVIHDCEKPSLAPRSCELYGNENGSCIDCYGDTDQLLSHSCSLTSAELITCTESVSSEGLRCTDCVDQNGGQVDRYCDTQVPELQQCARLDYTEQTCIVCVDQFDQPAAVQCDCNTAPDGAATCATPPACAFETGANGELCRTCPVGDAGETEQRCVVDTNLVCENVSGTTDGDPNQPVSTCLSCSDLQTGVEVYRRCDGQSPAPPVCAESSSATGTQCEICSDPQTQQDIYATCGGETCFALGQFQITGVAGNALLVDDAPAVSTCVQCASSADAAVANDLNAACTLRDDCGPVDLANPVAWCSSTVVFTLLPHACNNPWESAGYVGQPGTDEINRVLAFALEQGGVGLVAVDDAGTATLNQPTDSCDLARGDRLELAARAADATAVHALFDPVLAKCASDADCRTGGACRVDGSCTVAP